MNGLSRREFLNRSTWKPHPDTRKIFIQPRRPKNHSRTPPKPLSHLLHRLPTTLFTRHYIQPILRKVIISQSFLNAGSQAFNYTVPMGEDSVPRLQISSTERVEFAGQHVSSRDASDEIFNIPPLVPHFKDPIQQANSTQSAHVPLATAINPFFPPKWNAASSPHRRTREENFLELGETISEIPLTYNIQEDLYLELRILVSLEVMRTRYCF